MCVFNKHTLVKCLLWGDHRPLTKLDSYFLFSYLFVQIPVVICVVRVPYRLSVGIAELPGLIFYKSEAYAPAGTGAAPKLRKHNTPEHRTSDPSPRQ